MPILFLIILSFLAPNNSNAANLGQKITPYFEASTIEFNVLEAPKSAQNLEKQREIQEIIKLQKNATKQNIADAKNQFAIEVDKFVAFVDPNLTTQKYPQFFTLLVKTRVTAQEVKDRMKDHWHSAHPYQVSSKIKALGQTDRFYSYPSGHASKLYVLSYIIESLLPEQKNKFISKTDEILQLRVLIGEHFPSDIVAGKKLAEVVYSKLLQNAEFKKDFANAQKELKNYSAK